VVSDYSNRHAIFDRVAFLEHQVAAIKNESALLSEAVGQLITTVESLTVALQELSQAFSTGEPPPCPPNKLN
jgi:regulator of replication initiation timing